MASNRQTKDEQAEERQAAERDDEKTPSRAEIEAVEAGDVPSVLPPPTENVSLEQAGALGSGAPDQVLQDMEALTAQNAGSRDVDHTLLLADEIDERRAAREREYNDALSERQSMLLALDNDAAIRARPAAKVDDDLAASRPGATPRGWSPEVTARHPDLVAATMEELAGAGGGAMRGTAMESIDPTDPAAVERALMEIGFAEVRKNNLRQEAEQLNFERLRSAQHARQAQSPHVRAAFDQAIEAMSGESADRDGRPR
jgi:hypothetical protein